MSFRHTLRCYAAIITRMLPLRAPLHAALLRYAMLALLYMLRA